MLSDTEIENFQRDGCLQPAATQLSGEVTRLLPELKMLMASASKPEKIWSAIDSNSDHLAPIYTLYDSHLTNSAVMQLVKAPELHQFAEQVLGEPVAVWRSTFWIKPPQARRTEWHQDTFKEEGFGWFPNINAWIAIDETDPENCLRFVAGSHQRQIDLSHFQQQSYVDSLRSTAQLPAPPYKNPETLIFNLNCGEYVLFDGRSLHGSPPNLTPNRRAGLAVRFIPASLSLPGFDGQLITC